MVDHFEVGRYSHGRARDSVKIANAIILRCIKLLFLSFVINYTILFSDLETGNQFAAFYWLGQKIPNFKKFLT